MKREAGSGASELVKRARLGVPSAPNDNLHYTCVVCSTDLLYRKIKIGRSHPLSAPPTRLPRHQSRLHPKAVRRPLSIPDKPEFSSSQAIQPCHLILACLDMAALIPSDAQLRRLLPISKVEMAVLEQIFGPRPALEAENDGMALPPGVQSTFHRVCSAALGGLSDAENRGLTRDKELAVHKAAILEEIRRLEEEEEELDGELDVGAEEMEVSQEDEEAPVFPTPDPSPVPPELELQDGSAEGPKTREDGGADEPPILAPRPNPEPSQKAEEEESTDEESGLALEDYDSAVSVFKSPVKSVEALPAKPRVEEDSLLSVSYVSFLKLPKPRKEEEPAPAPSRGIGGGWTGDGWTGGRVAKRRVEEDSLSSVSYVSFKKLPKPTLRKEEEPVPVPSSEVEPPKAAARPPPEGESPTLYTSPDSGIGASTPITDTSAFQSVAVEDISIILKPPKKKSKNAAE